MTPATVQDQVRRRVDAAWDCIGVLRPDLDDKTRVRLARCLLDLCRDFNRARPHSAALRISAAQVTEMVWRHSQCIARSCPMLLFADALAEEINCFFNAHD